MLHTLIITEAETKARDIAAEVLAGKYDVIDGPFGRGGFYTAAQWRQAAQYAVDADDLSEVVYMLTDERSLEAGSGGWFGDDERRLDDLFYCEVAA